MLAWFAGSLERLYTYISFLLVSFRYPRCIYAHNPSEFSELFSPGLKITTPNPPNVSLPHVFYIYCASGYAAVSYIVSYLRRVILSKGGDMRGFTCVCMVVGSLVPFLIINHDVLLVTERMMIGPDSSWPYSML
ncbi:hypothetical protein L873DRAFT_1170438 [Choiromyces venosus 120613-1]|uniref:Uncharacterized protein n=1 Tax=Choiromyces venosus 120613-1 TaxID=1336337 RepID=A0A3N4K2F6_9PEZI|nr:hypothetical protein L873DRAFT_1170438 [Choiromyces venosus 120613-1]